MKDIKSVMIGFLLATCCFLFMGQTNNQQHPCSLGGSYEDATGNWYAYSERSCLQQGGTWIEGLEHKRPTQRNSNDNSNGRYTLSTSSWDNEIFITIIDTQTGKIVVKERKSMKNFNEFMDDINRMLNK